MARIANDVIGTLLGEAGGKTVAERYRDMLHIASTMVNRALATGQPLDSIVSAVDAKGRKQYDAFGKALPAGTDKLRAIAEMALAQVQNSGPVTTAMFMATPKAVGSLPKGLVKNTQTTTHIFFDDPQSRAILTAQGYAVPDPSAVASAFAAGAGLANLTGEVGYAGNYGPMRPDAPNSVLTSAITDAVGQTFGPGYGVLGISGQQTAAQKARIAAGKVALAKASKGYSLTAQEAANARYAKLSANKNNRHPTGLALDFDVIGPTGKKVTDANALNDLASNFAYNNPNAGIGFGPGYMTPGRMHLDLSGLAGAWGAGGVSSTMAPALAETIEAARQGFAPTPFSNPPTPTPRPSPDTAIASLASSPPQTANAAFGSTPSYSAESPASRALAEMAAKSQDTPISEIAGKQIGQPAVAPTDALATTNLPDVSYGPAPVAQAPALATKPPEVEAIPPPSVAQPAFTPKAVAPAPAPARAPAPSIPSGTKAALDFHAGLNNAAVASNGNTLTRDALGYSYNYSPEFDVTTISNPAGNTVGVKQGKVTADTAASATNASKGIFGLDQDTVSNSVVGGLGGLGGAAVGGLLGPVGSLIGSAIGRQLAVQNNPFATPGTQPSTGLFGLGGLGGLLGGIFGGRGSYPSAPSLAGALGGNQSNRSMGEMRDISPRAAGDISAGRQGLF